MDGVPTGMYDLVKDNIVVQWFLIIIFILLVGTNTATKLRGPLGSFARWVRAIGENRDEREAQERRRARERLLQEARDGREYVEREIHELKTKVGELMDRLYSQDQLVDNHLGWDYERRHQLIELGVKPADIPIAPPLRVSTPLRAQTPEHPSES